MTYRFHSFCVPACLIVCLAAILESTAYGRELPEGTEDYFYDVARTVSVQRLLEKKTFFEARYRDEDGYFSAFFDAVRFGKFKEDEPTPSGYLMDGGLLLKVSMLDGWLRLNLFGLAEGAGTTYPTGNTDKEGNPIMESIPQSSILVGGAGFGVQDYVYFNFNYVYTESKSEISGDYDSHNAEMFFTFGVPIIGLDNSLSLGRGKEVERNLTTVSLTPADIDRYIWQKIDFWIRPLYFPKLGVEYVDMGLYQPDQSRGGYYLYFADDSLVCIGAFKNSPTSPKSESNVPDPFDESEVDEAELDETEEQGLAPRGQDLADPPEDRNYADYGFYGLGIPVSMHIGLNESFANYYTIGGSLLARVAFGNGSYVILEIPRIEYGHTFNFYDHSQIHGIRGHFLVDINMRGKKAMFYVRALAAWGYNFSEDLWHFPVTLDRHVIHATLALGAGW